jgi:hypothetical protein
MQSDRRAHRVGALARLASYIAPYSRYWRTASRG